MEKLIEQAKKCQDASYILANASTDKKNKALNQIAEKLALNIDYILEANKKDIELAKANNKPESIIDRLSLNTERMNSIIEGVKQVISLDDPSNKILKEWDKDDLHFIKRSVPIGVIGIIFESRPNVCVDAACLCLKSGNVAFLRGSSDTLNSNIALVNIMQEALNEVDLPISCIELLKDSSHELATKFMQLNDYINLIIPRGGRNLIKNAVMNSTVPIIETGTGNCHIYVDETYNLTDAINIIINAKCQRVSVCNACESLLINEKITDEFLPLIIKELKEHNVLIHGDENVLKYDPSIALATLEDYGKEYLDYEISIKVVKDVDEAIKHINKYNTMHSDVIITNNEDNINKFLNEVDSACVYANASSRFSDGFEFGFGAEIGISTQKIHARGPMGLEALTSYKYQIRGNGTIRK